MNNLPFSVIICTYMRPQAVATLLNSLKTQTLQPLEIIIVDGSTDDATEKAVATYHLQFPIRYTRVQPEQRGLTRQRNEGVSMASDKSEILVFLDDDVVPEPDFFDQLIHTFSDDSVIGADGLITNENLWIPDNDSRISGLRWDGYVLPHNSRDILRAWLSLFPYEVQPGNIPPYGHGKSTLPPTGKQYEVEHIMGGITAYRKSLFSHISFSPYFEGYGLYEDFDFSTRANRYGKLITNTAARIAHYHAPSGRPNTYKYGKMVVRNGWYVWRQKHPRPGLKNIFKWHCITLLLALIRASNAFTLNAEQRRQAIGDAMGRWVGWLSLFINAPKYSAQKGSWMEGF